MEKRRNRLRFPAAALGLAVSCGTWACTPPLGGTTLESPRFVLSYQVQDVSVGAHFALEISSCSKEKSPEPESLKVDAHMPEHRHGMNYAPTLTKLGAQRWRAEGLMFHMPGRWEYIFDVRAADATERLISSIVIQ